MAGTQDQEYPLAQMKTEAERLHKQHVWIQSCLNNQIVFAPVDLHKPGLKILDVGCAAGSLLRDLQKQVSPSAQLVGVDLTAAFLPDSPQGNISYATGNVCEPPSSDLVEAIDLTHVRHLLVGCGEVNIDILITNLVATLKPGGWLQVQELDATLNEEAQKTATADLLRILGAIWDKTGPGVKIVHELKDAFVRAGLENVTSQRLQLPMGKKLEAESDREASLEPYRLSIPNIVRGAKALALDLPQSTFDSLQERFEKELLEEGAFMTSVLIYGQKPL